MRNLLIRGLAVLALATADAANAQSVGTPYSWAGCYVGVNGGYGWNSGSSSYNDANATGDPINFVPAPFSIFGTPKLSFIPTPSSTGGSGGLVGGTGGCNLQSRQWVVGVEADLDWAHISGTSSTSANSGPGQFAIGAANVPPLGVGFTLSGTNALGTATEQNTLQWFSTVRARGGVLVSDRLLVFATGGLALGGINSQGSVNIYNNFVSGLTLTNVWSGSTTSTRLGGVIGGGLEWALWDRTTVKAEYLWYTFGNVSHPLNCTLNGTAGCGFPDVYPTLGNTSSSVYGSVVRVGLNYKLW